MHRLLRVSGLVALVPGVANAQATSNAITSANDAFGFRRGDEAVGIYDETSARGFNLESAGNYRIHGTYFVKNSGVSSFFLESTAVRIGFNTLPVTSNRETWLPRSANVKKDIIARSQLLSPARISTGHFQKSADEDIVRRS